LQSCAYHRAAGKGGGMYGTIMRARVKPDQREMLRELLIEREGRSEIEGFHSVELAWEDRDSNRLVLIVHFRDKAAYLAAAESPEMDAYYHKVWGCFEEEPELVDVNYAEYIGNSLPA